MKRIYVVRKYVAADSLLDAHQKESLQPPDEVYMEDNHLKRHVEQLSKEEKPVGL